mgnify:CR=1 FL=1
MKKGEEKGYFEFGGSTIVLLLQHGKVRMDSDLIENSENGYETIVRMGERIGKCKLPKKSLKKLIEQHEKEGKVPRPFSSCMLCAL